MSYVSLDYKQINAEYGAVLRKGYSRYGNIFVSIACQVEKLES
jgi:hypothetical protein